MSVTRTMIIKTADNSDTIVYFSDLATRWNCEDMTDSKALHFFLCENEPGDFYTVEFHNITD